MTLKVGTSRVELPVTAYAPALSVVVKGDAMVPVIDAKDLAGPLTSSTTGVGRRAVDASFSFAGGRPVVVPGLTAPPHSSPSQIFGWQPGGLRGP